MPLEKEDIKRGTVLRRKGDKLVYIVYDVGDRVEMRDIYGNPNSTHFLSVGTVLSLFDIVPIEDTSRFERVLTYDVMGEEDAER